MRRLFFVTVLLAAVAVLGVPPAASLPGGDTALLNVVRVGSHNGFDRVVFEFFPTAPPPAVTVHSVDQVLADPSNQPVAVAGEHFWVISMTPSSTVVMTGGGPITAYQGPSSVTLGGPALDQVVQSGDFEGVLSWAAGVHTTAAPTVSTLSDPPRVVVDFAVVTPAPPAPPATPVPASPTLTG